MKKGLTLTPEVVSGLKPYQRTVFNAHDTKDDVFRLGQIEGRNQALYLLLAIGDENVAHDHWHPDRAQLLYETRVDICRRLKLNAPHYPSLGGEWPKQYPDFEDTQVDVFGGPLLADFRQADDTLPGDEGP